MCALVTGVQTCAFPISKCLTGRPPKPGFSLLRPIGIPLVLIRSVLSAAGLAGSMLFFASCINDAKNTINNVDGRDNLAEKHGNPRTEERRVGKECASTCKSRWSTDL